MSVYASNISTESLAEFSYSERIFAVCVLCVILICGTIGNAMVIIAVILSRKLQTRTNAFVVSLSVADLLYCLALFPTISALAGQKGWPFPRSEWLCDVGAFLLFTCGGVSIYNLAAIAVNRMVLITRPKVYMKVYSRINLAVMIFIIWITPALVILVPPLIGLGDLGYDYEDTTCTDLDQHPKGKTYNLIQASFLYPIPLILITVGYSRTFWYIRRHFKKRRQHVKKQSTFTSYSTTEYSNDSIIDMDTTKQSHRSFRKRQRIQEIQITKNLFLVVTIFFVCYSPYFMSLFVSKARHAVLYTGLIAASNSSMNPLIYCLKHPHFKAVLKAMVRMKLDEIPEPSSFSRMLS